MLSCDLLLLLVIGLDWPSLHQYVFIVYKYSTVGLLITDIYFREMIAEATKELSLVCAAASNGVLKMDWMYGIPLYSFLTDQFIPNESICSKSDQSLTSLWTHLSEKFYLKRARKKFRKKENK